MLVGYKKKITASQKCCNSDRNVSPSKPSMAAAGISLSGWVIPIPAGITKRRGLAENSFLLTSELISFQAHSVVFSFLIPVLVVVGALRRSGDGINKCVTSKT